ncbi:MAG: VOC family protein [Magnetospirillum sp. WYHS-4]
MIRYTGLHHPAFVTGDLERTVRFWRDLLGLKLVYTSGRQGDRQAFFSLDGRDTFIVFFEWPQVERIPYRRHGEPRQGPHVFDHLAIAVRSEADLWELMARLEIARMPVSDVIDHGFCRSLYSYDPNGLPIEFLWPDPAVDLAARPVFADRDPLPAAAEGPHPRPGFWPEPEQIPEEDRVVFPGAGHEDFPR